MMLTYLDRTTYRRKTQPEVLSALARQFGPCYVLPEGGSNGLAVRGCAELPGEIATDFDVICCACGTGGTLAGIAAGLTGQKRALGFAVLKGGQFLDDEVSRLQREAFSAETSNWAIHYDFHFGGYAKHTAALDDFITEFRTQHGISPDRIYEAKMLYGLFERIEAGAFPPPPPSWPFSARRLRLAVIGPLHGLRDIGFTPGQVPFAAVNPEIATEAEPHTFHSPPGRVHDHLQRPVVAGALVVPSR
jgi:1-aminocyclopropane-1-carboxylate deaminase